MTKKYIYTCDTCGRETSMIVDNFLPDSWLRVVVTDESSLNKSKFHICDKCATATKKFLNGKY